MMDFIYENNEIDGSLLFILGQFLYVGVRERFNRLVVEIEVQ